MARPLSGSRVGSPAGGQGPHPVVGGHDEGEHAEAGPEQTSPAQPARAVERLCGRRAGRTADEVADHVGGVDPAAGVRAQRVDQALVGHLHVLHPDVQHDDAQDQPGQRMVSPAQRGRKEASRQAGEDPGGNCAATLVGEPAGQLGAQRSGDTDQAEEPDHGVAVVIRAAREHEGDGRPENAEGGEGQGPQGRPAPQHGLGHRAGAATTPRARGSCGAGRAPLGRAARATARGRRRP